MTSVFKPAYCVESALPEVTEGQFYVATDTKRIFADLQGIRVPISEVITVKDEASLPLVPIRGKIYLALAEKSIWVYSGSWVQLAVQPIATTEKVGLVKVDGTSIVIDDEGVISTSIDNLLTDAQTAAINSGITATKVATYDEYGEDITSIEENMLYYDELK